MHRGLTNGESISYVLQVAFQTIQICSDMAIPLIIGKDSNKHGRTILTSLCQDNIHPVKGHWISCYKNVTTTILYGRLFNGDSLS